MCIRDRNYIKLLFEAAERYILLGVLVFTAPMAFATGSSQTTSNIFKSWCRMLSLIHIYKNSFEDWYNNHPNEF